MGIAVQLGAGKAGQLDTDKAAARDVEVIFCTIRTNSMRRLNK